MKRRLFLGLTLLVVKTVFALPWQEPQARFRIVAECADPNHPALFDTAGWLLPKIPDGKASVWSEQKKLAAYSSFQRIIIPAAPGKKRLIYFGFSGKAPELPALPAKLLIARRDGICGRLWQGKHPVTRQDWLRNNEPYWIRWRDAQIVAFHRSLAYSLLQVATAGAMPKPLWPPWLLHESLRRGIPILDRNPSRARYEQKLYLQPKWMREPFPWEAVSPRWVWTNAAAELGKRLPERLKREKLRRLRGAEDSLFRSLSSTVNWGWGRNFTPEKLHFSGQINDAFFEFSALVSTLQKIQETGRYEYEIISNMMLLWQLDGQELLRLHGGRTKRRTVLTELSTGLHRFTVFVRAGEKSNPYLLVRFRKAPNGPWRTFSTADCTAGIWLEPLAIEEVGRGEYPLIAVNEKLAFADSRTGRKHLCAFTVKKPAEPDRMECFRAALPEETIDYTVDRVLDGVDGGNLVFRDREKSFLPLPVQLVLRKGQRVYPVEAGLRVDVPDYVYRDDGGSFSVSSWCSWPESSEMIFRFGNFREVLKLGGKFPERSFSFPVNSLSDGVEDAALELPGFVLDRQSVVPVPVPECGALHWKPGRGFFDSAGRHCVIVLNRPGVSQLRKWEVPAKIGRELRKPEGLLVLTEREQPLAAELLAAWPFPGKRQMEYFVARNPLEEMLPRLNRLLSENKTQSQAAALILPQFSALAEREAYLRERALAALLELLNGSGCSGSCRVILPPDPEGQSKAFQSWRNVVQRLCREYGVSFCDCNEPPILREKAKKAKPDQ